jgi:uncharacterized protein (TIGR02147 family)
MRTCVSVFQYQSYQELLLALIEQRKQNGKPFSYRWFSARAGLTSPNFLQLVVKGKRHLSGASVEKVIEIFHLKKEEGEFFRALVQFNKAKSLSEKEHYAHQLLRFKQFQKQYPLSKDQFEYYSEWYNIPVREFFALKQRQPSPEEISEALTPSVSLAEIQNSISKLKSLELLIEKNGKLEIGQESLTTGHKFSSYGVVKYHKKMLQLAAESLDRFAAAEREVSSVTIGLSDETFSKIKKMIEDFRSQLIAIAEADQSKERLYQINFQLFPLTKKKVNSQ